MQKVASINAWELTLGIYDQRLGTAEAVSETDRNDCPKPMELRIASQHTFPVWKFERNSGIVCQQQRRVLRWK